MITLFFILFYFILYFILYFIFCHQQLPFSLQVYIRLISKMEISSPDDPTKQIGESPSNVIPPKMSPCTLAVLIGSALTPTTNIDISTPQEPSQRCALIDCFDPITCFEEAEEAEYYDSHGNGPSSVNESQFKHFKLKFG